MVVSPWGTLHPAAELGEQAGWGIEVHPIGTYREQRLSGARRAARAQTQVRVRPGVEIGEETRIRASVVSHPRP